MALLKFILTILANQPVLMKFELKLQPDHVRENTVCGYFRAFLGSTRFAVGMVLSSQLQQ